MTINWNPASQFEEVDQNIRCLLATEPGTVPLARAMGTPQDALDSPMSAAGARLTADVIRAVKAYEPRAKVEKVTVTGDADGRLGVTVKFAAGVVNG